MPQVYFVKRGILFVQYAVLIGVQVHQSQQPVSGFFPVRKDRFIPEKEIIVFLIRQRETDQKSVFVRPGGLFFKPVATEIEINVPVPGTGTDAVAVDIQNKNRVFNGLGTNFFFERIKQNDARRNKEKDGRNSDKKV